MSCDLQYVHMRFHRSKQTNIYIYIDAKSRRMQNDLAVELHTVEQDFQIKALIKKKSISMYTFFHPHFKKTNLTT